MSIEEDKRGEWKESREEGLFFVSSPLFFSPPPPLTACAHTVSNDSCMGGCKNGAEDEVKGGKIGEEEEEEKGRDVLKEGFSSFSEPSLAPVHLDPFFSESLEE